MMSSEETAVSNDATASDETINSEVSTVDEVLRDISSRIDISRIYHQRRERFFELFDKGAKIASLALGSAAVLKFAEADASRWMTALMTVMSAASLVFSFSERARRHSELARTYGEFITEIESLDPRQVTAEKVFAWRGKLREIETKEPRPLGALVIASQNEFAVSEGREHSVIWLGICRSALMHFVDMSVPLTRTRNEEFMAKLLDLGLVLTVLILLAFYLGVFSWIDVKQFFLLSMNCLS